MNKVLAVLRNPIFISIVIADVFLLLAILRLLKGPQFMRSSNKATAAIVALAKEEGVIEITDLGAGDGKLLVALAQAGIRAKGYEFDPFLVKKCEKNIKSHQLENLATVEKKDFWTVDFHSTHAVVIFGITHIMKKLEKKLVAELPFGAIIISNHFTFPTLSPVTKKDDVTLYRITK